MIMKSLHVWLIPLLTCSLLIGCTPNLTKVEINQQAFVFALYVDKGKQEGNVEVTISAPLPNRLTSGKQSGGQGNGAPYAMITRESSTIQDALSLIQRDITRRFDFSHARVVIVGRSYAEAGLEDLMDWLQREPTTTLNIYLMVAPGDAKKVAGLTPIFEQMPSEVLMRIEDQHNVIPTRLRDCLYAESGNQGYALTYLSAGLKPKVVEQDKPEPWTGVQGIALFQNHKMLATVPLKESLAVSWAVNEIKGPLYTISWDEKGKASIFLIATKSSRSIRMVSGHPVFTIRLSGTGDVIYKRNHNQYDTRQVKQLMERELNKQITEDLRKALHTSQRVGADVLQLGMLVDWNYPNHWKQVRANWSDYYKNEVEIEVVTDIRIRNFGSILKTKPK